MNAMKVNGEGSVKLHSFLTSALDGRLNSASRPGRFNSGPRVPTTRFIEVQILLQNFKLNIFYPPCCTVHFGDSL